VHEAQNIASQAKKKSHSTLEGEAKWDGRESIFFGGLSHQGINKNKKMCCRGSTKRDVNNIILWLTNASGFVNLG